MKNAFVRYSMIGLALASFSLVGCAKGSVYRRADAMKIDYAKEKFIVMPVDIHGLPGDKLKYSAALFGGFVGAFGSSGISLQPIKPALEAAGLGNLSWKLAHGIFHTVSYHGIYDLKKDSDKAELAAIPELVGKLAATAASALKLDFKPRFIVMAHIDGQGKGTIPKTIKYRVIGAIYDLQAQKVHAVTYYVKTTAEDALMAEMATIGKQLFSVLSKADQG